MLALLALALCAASPSAPSAFLSFPGGPRSVGTVGDIDGDGHSDLLVGLATRREKSRSQRGGVYLFSGKEARLLCDVGPPDPALYFGMSVCGFADLDRDGARDFVVGAPGMSVGRKVDPGPGAVLVYSSRTGALLLEIRGKQRGDRLGHEVARAGDVDRDGVEDILAGAPGINMAFVFSGKDGTVLRELHAREPHTELGTSVAGLGDVDDDGVPDVAVGAIGPRTTLAELNSRAPGSAQYDGAAGAVLVFAGRDGSLLRSHTPDFCSAHSVTGCRFGVSIDSAGDANGDGVLDLLVGADQAGRDTNGRAFVFSGKDASLLREMRGNEDWTNTRFGTSVAAIGDVDDDGTTDWAIANSDDDMNFEVGQAPGCVHAVSGKDGKELWQVFGDVGHDHFGFAVAAAGDVDGDRIPDVIARNDPGARLPYVRVYSGKDGRLIHDLPVPFQVAERK